MTNQELLAKLEEEQARTSEAIIKLRRLIENEADLTATAKKRIKEEVAELTKGADAVDNQR